MAFNKPVLLDIISFDASEEQRIYFNVNGGDLHTRVLVTITERNTPNIIYKQLTLVADHDFFVLAANTLENNKYYAMVIQIGDGTTWSEKSQSDYFSCFAKSTVSINDVNPDGTTVITKRTYTFTGSYTQPDDPLRYYRFYIYNEDGSLFYDSGNQYSLIISTQVSNFENETNYDIALEVVSQSGILSRTGKIHFRVKYQKTGIESQMNVVGDPYSGDVSIRAIIKDQDGEFYGYENGVLYEVEDNPQFVTHKDNDGIGTRWISLPSNRAVLFATDDFFVEVYTLTIWFTRLNLTGKIEIAKIYCGESTIQVLAAPTVIEMLCDFNGRETIYHLDIEPLTTSVNEILRITIDDCWCNMEYEKGGSIE